MKKTFLAFLGASTLAMSAAHAADMSAPAGPVVAPEPESGHVAVCDAFGTGYFFIPGTETCLRVSGAVSFSGGYDSRLDEAFASAEARVDFDTRADSEFGTIGTKLRLSSRMNDDAYSVFRAPGRINDVELAYVSVGPAYAGYKDTLFNTDLGYGDFDLETVGGDMNAMTVGYMRKDVLGGFYGGVAVETAPRGSFAANEGRFASDYTPDFVGRVGYEDGRWGSFDLSALHSEANDGWLAKATADVNASDALAFRLTAGYGEAADDYGYFVGGAAKYAFADTVSAFSGATYFDAENAVEPFWNANAGVTWTPARNLDVTGQVSYSDIEAEDGYNTKLTVTRSF